MKKTDIAMIILIASISVLVSYFVMSSLPVFQEASQPQRVPVADKISEETNAVDESIFSDQAINPTVEVIIGESGE